MGYGEEGNCKLRREVVQKQIGKGARVKLELI